MAHKFGGTWTVDKLEKVGKYVNAYSVALQRLRVKRIYVDAFAGTGTVDIRIDGNEITIDGSARIALSGDCPH
jgi:three-Cys-motif partner protein